MNSWRAENANTLASLLRVGAEKAAQLLDITLVIRSDESDRAAGIVANHLRTLLVRTVSGVRINASPDAAAEIVIGSATRTCPTAVRVSVSGDAIYVGTAAPNASIPVDTPPIVLLLAACYAAGTALRAALGEALQVSGPPPAEGMTIPLRAILGRDPSWLSKECEATDTYLAGAGAIGNGFVYALTLLRVRGTLTVIDPDRVSDGNLNRCVWFTGEDVGKHKAPRLCEAAAPQLPHMELAPVITTLQRLGKPRENARWLNRLIVAVDSRRTRRQLQGEIPREVFDASTTGAAEIVLHHHVQPTPDACLACVYVETPDELAHERHIAKALGVTTGEIKEHFVSKPAARRIHARYPRVPIRQLEGQAYDSLFKALCSQGALAPPESHEPAAAPFAFISVLAGACLALDMCRRLASGNANHTLNYWRISPWSAPVEALKQTLPRNPACDFCSQPALLRVTRELWGTKP